MPEPTLRARLVSALQCAPSVLMDTPEDRDRHASNPRNHHISHLYYWGCAVCRGEVDTLADAVLAVVQPELDRLTQERDAADEALHGQPVLRHCVLPGCLREFDMSGGLSGRPVRESWSSKGWLMLPSLHSHICPEHTALVADGAHRPNWDRSVKPTVLVCACGWRSPGVRWSGFATATWQDHLLTVTEET